MSFIGLELAEAPVVVEGEETGGEEDEGESRPGQPQVEIRRDKWETRREMSHKRMIGVRVCLMNIFLLFFNLIDFEINNRAFVFHK